MGLRDRIDRIERGEPEDAPVCETCGQSFDYMTTYDAYDDPDNPTYRGGRRPCEACDADWLRWAHEHGVVIKIVYEEAPTREEYEEWRSSRNT